MRASAYLQLALHGLILMPHGLKLQAARSELALELAIGFCELLAAFRQVLHLLLECMLLGPPILPLQLEHLAVGFVCGCVGV